MKCSKTMLYVAGALAAAAAGAYFALPEVRSWLAASLPLLVALVCPISMLVMMRSMHGGATAREAVPAAGPRAVGSEPATEVQSERSR